MNRRVDRLAEEIREEIAALLSTGLKDPRIGFVTVIRVDLTADLRLARVYVGVLGGAAERSRSLEGLQQAAGYVRRELGRRIKLRHTPEITFVYDTGLEATDRVAQILADNPPRGDDPSDE